LDFSTGVVANGKIMAAKDRGEKIPLGWGLDAQGRDTTDPNAVATLLPLGGAKGAGLSFMIEILTSLLLSNPRLAPDLEDGSIEANPFLNGAAIAIDIGGFGDPTRFESEASRIGRAIAGLARADGVERIMLPGERGDAIRAEREAHGIPIPAGTWQRIAKAAQAVGVKPPM
jgi:ureidoglycolate dehydrogenase (NAD+)